MPNGSAPQLVFRAILRHPVPRKLTYGSRDGGLILAGDLFPKTYEIPDRFDRLTVRLHRRHFHREAHSGRRDWERQHTDGPCAVKKLFALERLAGGAIEQPVLLVLTQLQESLDDSDEGAERGIGPAPRIAGGRHQNHRYGRRKHQLEGLEANVGRGFFWDLALYHALWLAILSNVESATSGSLSYCREVGGPRA